MYFTSPSERYVRDSERRLLARKKCRGHDRNLSSFTDSRQYSHSIGMTLRKRTRTPMKKSIWGACLGSLLAMARAQLNDVPDSCDLCSGEALRPEQEIPLLQVPCSEAAVNVSQLSTEACATSLMPGFDVSSFCCENFEAPNMCNLCSEQEQIILSRLVTSEQYGEVTCATIQEAASLVISFEVCTSLQQEAASYCCIDLSNFASPPCELLCPDGAPPSDLSKRDPVSGYTCSDLMFDYSRFEDGDQCQASAASSLGFDGVAFCCPDVDPPHECSTCVAGQELLYPERILFLYQDHSCVTLDKSLAYVVGETKCLQILAESRAENNCQCRPLRQQGLPSSPPIAMLNGGVNSLSASRHMIRNVLFLLLIGVQSMWVFD